MHFRFYKKSLSKGISTMKKSISPPFYEVEEEEIVLTEKDIVHISQDSEEKELALVDESKSVLPKTSPLNTIHPEEIRVLLVAVNDYANKQWNLKKPVSEYFRSHSRADSKAFSSDVFGLQDTTALACCNSTAFGTDHVGKDTKVCVTRICNVTNIYFYDIRKLCRF